MKTLLALMFLSTAALADVNEIDNHKTHAVDCAKDPTVRVSGNSNTFTLKGTCKSVQISGNKNTVKGDGVTSLMLSGNENTVTLAIENAMISGDKNTVSYRGKKPSIADTGEKNAITPAK
ncbi:MAG TPA: DUF3060 domain-containing protein [Kofleriaceae bacterium]|nr:DUF3060 domain-containing protein [Kofleriaceae bacterium]